MKTPESIIRGIMHESVMSEVKRHVGSTNPTTVAKHFKHDEEAAKQIKDESKRIRDLAGSMEEQIQLNEAQNYLYGINHTSSGASRETIKLAKLLGYTLKGPGGSNNTYKVYHGDRMITQISASDTGPAGNKRPLADIHKHQSGIENGFSGTEHNIGSISRARRGLSEEAEQLDELSTPTLLSYIGKASEDLVPHSMAVGSLVTQAKFAG